MKRQNTPLLFLLLLFLFNSCYSYKLAIKTNSLTKQQSNRSLPKAYVVNPELEYELSILEHAQLFELTNDSLNTLKIQLYPIEPIAIDLMGPFTLVLLTLGQVPIHLSNEHPFRFDEIYPDETRTFATRLRVKQRLWFWDFFSSKKDFAKVAGKDLQQLYLENNPR